MPISYPYKKPTRTLIPYTSPTASPTGGGVQAIPDQSIITPKLAHEAVTADKLSPNAVTAEKVADAAILGRKIASRTITGGNIQKGTLTQDLFDPTVAWTTPATIAVNNGLSSPYTINGASGTLYTNSGCTAEVALQLPATVIGTRYEFAVESAYGMRIIAASGDVIKVLDSTTIQGGYIESLEPGSTIKLVVATGGAWTTMPNGIWDVQIS